MKKFVQLILVWMLICLQWYILTVGGVILIILTIIYAFTSTVSTKSIAFVNASHFGWAWLIALSWCGLYFLAMKRLKNRIIEDRLCLRCGEILKLIELDEDGDGLCPGCNTIFNICEYQGPSQSAGRLLAVKQRVVDHFPSTIELAKPKLPSAEPIKIVVPIGGLHRNRTHFDRTMKQAADKLILGGEIPAKIIFMLIGTLIPTIPIIYFFAPNTSAGWKLLIFIGLPVASLFIVSYYFIQKTALVARFINHYLCISCGYALRGLETDEFGCGKCPECGRKFHPEEYTPPPREVENPDWQTARLIIFGRNNIEDDDEAIRGETSYQFEFLAYQPEPPDSDRADKRCQFCNYSLVGTPRSQDGIGVCSECGKPFNHGLKPIPQIKSY